MAQAVTFPAIQAPVTVEVKPRPRWLPAWRRLSHNKPALFGLAVIILLIFTGIFGPMLAPYNYASQDLNNVLKAPSSTHLLGTDELGRDMLTRLIYGARSVLFVIVVVSLLSLTLGLPLGALAGYFGGWIDTIISRTGEVVNSFPGLLFVLIVAATIKPGIINWMRNIGLTDFVRSGFADYLVVIVALGVIGWVGLARLVRGQILALREKDYVLSARAIGLRSWKIILKYLMPNALSPIIVVLSMGLGDIALSEGILSYLGIGLQPPNPSWGNIIADNAPIHWRDWPGMIWLVLIPGAVVALVVFAFNFFGDGLNEALNPELY
jgi:ABC-type dipeptide/oligopeptide/nickel transport system permease subunit